MRKILSTIVAVIAALSFSAAVYAAAPSEIEAAAQANVKKGETAPKTTHKKSAKHHKHKGHRKEKKAHKDAAPAAAAPAPAPAPAPATAPAAPAPAAPAGQHK